MNPIGAMKTVHESVLIQDSQCESVTGRTLADRGYDFIEENEFAILGILLILVTVFSLLRSHHKLFWYDEIFTIIVASQPNFHSFLAAMPAEGNPPLIRFS